MGLEALQCWWGYLQKQAKQGAVESSNMTVPGLVAVAAVTESVSDGAGSVPGWDSHPDSAAMSHQCRQERICDLSIVLLSLLPLLLPASLPMPRVSLSHGSGQKAKFNFADITGKPEPALAA